MSNSNIATFEQAIPFPDIELKERLDSLIGLDYQKETLYRILSLLVNPQALADWSKKFHSQTKVISSYLLRRPPLIVLEGDVGSGKTELATTIGDMLARKNKIDVLLLPLSLTTRGQGRVGEMTKLISDAFTHTLSEAEKLVDEEGKIKGAIILLVDEADALAQSRENNQMHHEDKSGVNAFIRGIDRIANKKVPAAVIMCTNRINSIDPAVKRRAAQILKFMRPTSEQRAVVLSPLREELGLTNDTIDEIVKLTGINADRDFGFTFSDLTQRLIPSIVLNAFPDKAVTDLDAISVTQNIVPTKPFVEN